MPKKLRPAVDLMAFKCRTLKVKEPNTGITQEMTVYFQFALASCCLCCHVFCVMYVANLEIFFVNELSDFRVLILSTWWKAHFIGPDPS
jgi:hypothetical protein